MWDNGQINAVLNSCWITRHSCHRVRCDFVDDSLLRQQPTDELRNRKEAPGETMSLSFEEDVNAGINAGIRTTLGTGIN